MKTAKRRYAESVSSPDKIVQLYESGKACCLSLIEVFSVGPDFWKNLLVLDGSNGWLSSETTTEPMVVQLEYVFNEWLKILGYYRRKKYNTFILKPFATVFATDCPQQKNSTDCGAWLCIFMDSIGDWEKDELSCLKVGFLEQSWLHKAGAASVGTLKA
ncbi:hypothetical protein E3N88_09034 [Mikania micrantha]|uniref:Ubiquitin-like protease family profile domain-containing protein n=1 Tax=Mikania micrantha TaxID=192012 RepID=A0A5N6PIW6_9ASTR|nr:hypothetical protein E3N88_09034 [Mikania micrantha]